MGKKYIIEKDDNESIWSIYADADGDATIEGVSLTPYTEPDLEQIRKEGYQQGAEDMRKALRLLIDCDDDCLTIPDVFYAFGEGSYHAVVRKHPAMEIIEKIRQYEQEKEEIKVGDEVEAVAGKAVIIEVLGNGKDVRYMYPDASTGFNDSRNVTRTGRHFPEIAEVLQKMRGE